MTLPAETPPTPGHETRDVRISAIVKAAIGVTVLVIFTMVTMAPLLGFYRERVARESPKASPLAGQYGLTEPPEPRLQIDPAADLAALRGQEAKLLDSYGWADQASGKVRIPIARAMELLVERRAAAQAQATEGAR